MFETKEDTQGPKHPQEDGPITARMPWQPHKTNFPAP